MVSYLYVGQQACLSVVAHAFIRGGAVQTPISAEWSFLARPANLGMLSLNGYMQQNHGQEDPVSLRPIMTAPPKFGLMYKSLSASLFSKYQILRARDVACPSRPQHIMNIHSSHHHYMI